MPIFPEIFKPIRELTRLGTCYYRDLVDHDFTGIEKLFLVEHLKSDKIDVNNEFYTGILNKDNTKVVVARVEKRYSIKHSTLCCWIKRNKDGQILYDYDVRTLPLIDDIGINEISAILLDNRRNVLPLSTEATNILFSGKASQTWQRRHPGRACPPPMDLDTRTIEKIKKKNNISDRKPQDLTQARYDAASDIRLVYGVAIMKEAFSGHLAPCNIWNMDATHAIIKPTGSGMKVCIVREKDVPEYQVTSREIIAGLNVIIKIFPIGNAAGEIPEPVLIVALDELPDGTFYANKVVGMCNGSGVGSGGLLIACQSRCGCPALWKYFFTNYVIPNIVSSADIHDRKVKNISRLRFIFLWFLFRMNLAIHLDVSYHRMEKHAL